MYTLEELHEQNRDISLIMDMLEVVIEHKNLRGNPYNCELIKKFREKVWMHLVFEDNTIYAELSRHPNTEVADAAKKFHDSARLIKKRFSKYIKGYCNSDVSDEEHSASVIESREIFALIRDRISYEEEYMFPLVEKHHND